MNLESRRQGRGGEEHSPAGLASPPTTLPPNNARLITSEKPSVEIGIFLLPRDAAETDPLVRIARKPPGIYMRLSQPDYSIF